IAQSDANNKDIKLNYLQIPITLNYRLLEWLSIQAGPQFSVLLDNEKTLLQNGKEAFSSGDFSMVGGAQINFGAIRVTGRYMLGLNDISSSEVNEAWKNRGFQLGVGIKIL
ncbi:MAG: outer membrane beta-barrel protein, partial [Flavihumibacter sp.]